MPRIWNIDPIVKCGKKLRIAENCIYLITIESRKVSPSPLAIRSNAFFILNWGQNHFDMGEGQWVYSIMGQLNEKSDHGW
jgi:hypothetical protein